MKPWWEQAACAGLPTDLFFGDARDHTDRAAAVRVCQSCPVRNECLEDDLATLGVDEPRGVRAAMTAPERKRMVNA